MNSTLKMFAALLVATALFHTILNYMLGNIEDFETVPLPPKKIAKISTTNPLIKIDASSKELWTLVDFSSGNTYHVAEPEEEKARLQKLSWDIAFQRTKIITNSGVTNPKGGVEVANLGPLDMNAITEVPQSGFTADSRSFGKLINKNIAGWYNYRTRTHNIESKKNIYVVKTADGQFMKMKIWNYYCARPEADCQTVMCTREEAACLTVEYLFSQDGKRFPAPEPALTNPPENLG